MLTQAQVDKIHIKLRLYEEGLRTERKKIYHRIANEVGCSLTTVADIHLGRRAPPGKSDEPEYAKRRGRFVCPSCGPVIGETCIRCDLQNVDLSNELPLDEGPGPGPNDPSPELIAIRCGIIRMQKEHKRKINYSDPGIALWVAAPADVLRIAN